MSMIVNPAIVGPVYPSTKTIKSYTGADQQYVVPDGVTRIRFKMWGAGGPGDNWSTQSAGAGGGFTTGEIKVNPGETLTVIVGQAGKAGNTAGADTGTYGGGGRGDVEYSGTYAGTGGGRSAIRRGTTELATAGGAGGGGNNDTNGTGAGGGPTGLDGNSYGSGPEGGHAGTQTAGGAPGTNTTGPAGTAGTQFQGGSGGRQGGGGGGGYYGGGGGGGTGGSGGGGSGYIAGCISDGSQNIAATTTSGVGRVPPQINDPDYGDNAGYGASAGSTGTGNGRVVIW